MSSGPICAASWRPLRKPWPAAASSSSLDFFAAFALARRRTSPNSWKAGKYKLLMQPRLTSRLTFKDLPWPEDGCECGMASRWRLQSCQGSCCHWSRSEPESTNRNRLAGSAAGGASVKGTEGRRLVARGFKGLRLTAGRPEKRQCSTCCHDFRNRAA